MKRLKQWAWVGLILAGTAAADAAPPAASIDDLAWMTGAWEGPMGENAVLQETWLEPADDAMIAAVRMLEDGKTNMVELIVIEESEGTLIFRIQQWSKSYEPRMPAPQKMVLAELGENSVRFESQEDGNAFRSLTYSRPSLEAFNIRLELTEPPTTLDINLRRR